VNFDSDGCGRWRLLETQALIAHYYLELRFVLLLIAKEKATLRARDYVRRIYLRVFDSLESSNSRASLRTSGRV